MDCVRLTAVFGLMLATSAAQAGPAESAEPVRVLDYAVTLRRAVAAEMSLASLDRDQTAELLADGYAAPAELAAAAARVERLQRQVTECDGLAAELRALPSGPIAFWLDDPDAEVPDDRATVNCYVKLRDQARCVAAAAQAELETGRAADLEPSDPETRRQSLATTAAHAWATVVEPHPIQYAASEQDAATVAAIAERLRRIADAPRRAVSTLQLAAAVGHRDRLSELATEDAFFAREADDADDRASTLRGHQDQDAVPCRSDAWWACECDCLQRQMSAAARRVAALCELRREGFASPWECRTAEADRVVACARRLAAECERELARLRQSGSSTRSILAIDRSGQDRR